MNTPNPEPRTPNPGPRFRAGFSLIEILVTVSIIVLLVGISFPVALKMLASADTSTARGTLAGLAAAADEYNIVTQQVVLPKGDATNPFGGADLAVDFTDSATNNTLGWFVYQAGAVPTVSKLVTNAAKKNLTYQGNPVADTTDIVNAINADNNVTAAEINAIQILDPWENPIRYAGGVSHNDGNPDDDYLPAHPTAFFASAGPDGLWGEVDDNNQPDPGVDADGDGVPDAADNIYSFQTDQ